MWKMVQGLLTSIYRGLKVTQRYKAGPTNYIQCGFQYFHHCTLMSLKLRTKTKKKLLGDKRDFVDVNSGY